MLEILQFYVSGFWTWLGITIGAWMLIACTAAIIGAVAGVLRRR